MRLTLDDVILNDDRVLLRLGGDGVELPEPVAALVTTFLADPRYRRNTAANSRRPVAVPRDRARPATLHLQ